MNVKYKRKELIELLQNNECRIVFTKKDGTIREMERATLKSDLLPVMNIEDGEKLNIRPVNESILTVYEIGTGWRSMIIDNIIEPVEVVENGVLYNV